MMRTLTTTIAAVACLPALVTPAAAEMVEKTGSFSGLQVTYKVVLPNGYDPARTYPVILVFGGGPQTLRTAEGTVNSVWREEAERRGYVVISPGTPNGALFFESADRIFPEFLDMIVREYKVAPGRLHIAGISNGGLSAFHIAAKHPDYFATVTGYPGLLDVNSREKIQALKPMCLFMHVGDQDSGWLSAMRQQADMLRGQSYRISYVVEKNQGHIIRAADVGLSPRLFDQIESCKR
jgi:poly(3-hydroxybutyrate) depolymerase